MGHDIQNPFSLEASTDLSASQYCAVTIDTNGRLALPSAGGSIVGILYTKPAAIDKAGEVYGCGAGVLKAKYGGTVTAGDILKVDATGKFVTASGSDIAIGAGIAAAVTSGSSGDVRSIVLFGSASVASGVGGVDDIVLGTTAPSATTDVTFAQTTGTKTGALGAGKYTGQRKRIVQSVAASTPVGTITGTFKTQAGAAATTLALGTAVATIGDFVWDGAAWRLTSAVTGTGSSLS